MGIRDYSATPASNTALFPENMNPSAVNDGMRQVQADLKTFADDTPVLSDVYGARADVASAPTTDIGATSSIYVRITGTTTITGLGTAAAGIVRDVVFAGALTLTHEATSLILPGGANITTAAGDTALFRSEGSGNWRCVRYQPAPASQAQMESASDTLRPVTAGRQHFHLAHAKAIVVLTSLGSASPTVTTLYSAIGTITASRTGTGNYLLSWVTALASGGYVFPMVTDGAPKGARLGSTGTTSTAQQLLVSEFSAGAASDPTAMLVLIFGDAA